MQQLAVVILSGPQNSDDARGLLEILHGDHALALTANWKTLHVHSMTDDHWPGHYRTEHTLFVPGANDPTSYLQRLQAGVDWAQQTQAQTLLVLSSDVWALQVRWLLKLIEVFEENDLLLGAASTVHSDVEKPPLQLWSKMILLNLGWQRSRRLFPLPWHQWQATALLAAASWQQLSVGQCLSAAYFQTVVDDEEILQGQKAAHQGLMRFNDLEPIVLKGTPQQLWHQRAVVCGSALRRQQIIRDMKAQSWGPTLQRLATSKDFGWYNQPGPHPKNSLWTSTKN